MKPSELKQLIKEEIRSTLTEEKKYLNDMSYEELLAHRKRMDFKKASREEKKYVKDLIDKKKPLSEDSEDISSIKIITKDDTLRPIGVIDVNIGGNYMSENSPMYLSRKDDRVYIIDNRGNIFGSNEMGGSLILYGHIEK